MKKMSLLALIALFALSGCQSHINGYEEGENFVSDAYEGLEYDENGQVINKKPEEENNNGYVPEDERDPNKQYTDEGIEIDPDEEIQYEKIDIDEWEESMYKDKVIEEKIPLKEYKNFLTEKEVIADLKKRNLLSTEPVYAVTDLDGNVEHVKFDESNATDTKHLCYRVDLETDALWNLTYLGDQITAEMWGGQMAVEMPVITDQDYIMNFNAMTQVLNKMKLEDDETKNIKVDLLNKQTLLDQTRIPDVLLPQYVSPSKEEAEAADEDSTIGPEYDYVEE